MELPGLAPDTGRGVISRTISRIDWRQFGGMLGLLVAIMLLWSTPVVYPLKILVVFFHELSHGLAAVLTGGRIVEIAMVAQEGGHCVTAGGSDFLITSAGYLGSLVWGGVILVLAARTRFDQQILGSLGALLIFVALAWIRPFLGFGFWFSVVTGGALIALAVYTHDRVSDILLRIIGLTSCLYAVFDIKDDILDRPGLHSDAWHLAQQTGLPVWFWGILWILIAVVAAAWFLVVASSGTRPPRQSP